MLDGVHPSLEKALKLDNECWHVGGPPIIAETESGSEYTIQSDGSMRGGEHIGPGDQVKLTGAVYRQGGPIRLDQVVVGLGIEAFRKGDGKTLTTTAVTRIATLDA